MLPYKMPQDLALRFQIADIELALILKQKIPVATFQHDLSCCERMTICPFCCYPANIALARAGSSTRSDIRDCNGRLGVAGRCEAQLDAGNSLLSAAGRRNIPNHYHKNRWFLGVEQYSVKIASALVFVIEEPIKCGIAKFKSVLVIQLASLPCGANPYDGPTHFHVFRNAPVERCVFGEKPTPQSLLAFIGLEDRTRENVNT
jgi:hypothetical protein